MGKTSAEVKQRHNAKKHAMSEEIRCACGCGGTLKSVSPSGRARRFIHGHGTRKHLNRREYAREYAREYGKAHRKEQYARRLVRHRQLRVKLILMRGGVCEGCMESSYNGRNGAIFHFHHTDPTTKLFNIGNGITNKSWQTILAEAAKCVMLCANCHELQHSAPY